MGMDVYVESNFVLEVALRQEQHKHCQSLIEWAEQNHIQLILPAFSLAEPYETQVRRAKNRKQLSDDLTREVGQLRRSLPYREYAATFQEVTSLLVRSQEEERQRLHDTTQRITASGEVVPLTGRILIDAIKVQQTLDLSPQDAIVYTSVETHLENAAEGPSCFLNRNSKDFGDPDIVDSLASKGCRILFDFTDGFDYVTSQI